MGEKLIIAIDGYSACGKSTLARQLAEKLDYIYVDTGAMYRAITLFLLRNDIDIEQEQQLAQALEQIELSFELNAENGQRQIHLNGENVNDFIRGLAVAEKVSFVAAKSLVRKYAIAKQREIGKPGGVVLEGRDIGTGVFPDADLKIFMTADIEVRVDRRFAEFYKKNPEISRIEVKSNLEKRDYVDTNRALNPLKQAEDARVLDNTHLDREEQLQLALDWVNEVLNKKNKENE